MHRRPLLLPLLAALLAPGMAFADDVGQGPARPSQKVRLDLHADLGGYASLGVGGRADIPLIRGGLLADVDDELALSPGLDLFFVNLDDDYYDGGPYLIPSCVLQWNFYPGPRWSIFPEAGLALFVGDGEHLRRGRSVYAAPAIGLGFRYQVGERGSLLARISTPTGLQLGVSF